MNLILTGDVAGGCIDDRGDVGRPTKVCKKCKDKLHVLLFVSSAKVETIRGSEYLVLRGGDVCYVCAGLTISIYETGNGNAMLRLDGFTTEGGKPLMIWHEPTQQPVALNQIQFRRTNKKNNTFTNQPLTELRSI